MSNTNSARKLSNPRITVNNPSPKRSISVASSRSPASSSTASPRTVKPVEEKSELNLTLYGGPAPRRDARCVSSGTSKKKTSKNDQKNKSVAHKDIECSSLLNSEVCDDDFLIDLSTMSETDTEKVSMKPNYVSPNLTRRNSSSTYRRNSAGSAGSRRSKTSAYSPRNAQASRSSSRKSSLGVIKSATENSELLQLLEMPRSVISPTETSSSVSSSRRTTPGNSSHLSSSQSSVFDLSSESATPSARSETTGDSVTTRTYISSSSSCYMSWADHSLNSEYFSKTPSEVDAEEKDGEWGYFWRNYNSSINSYRKSHSQKSNQNEARNESVTLQQELADLGISTSGASSGSLSQVTLTADEAEEAANCAQRLADILRQAMKKPVQLPNSKKSLNGNQKVLKSYSEPELFKRQTPVTAKELKEQKKLLRPVKSSSVNVSFENSGVLDVANILRKAIEKRRDFLIPPEEICNTYKSDWSAIE